jgi:hypothetical protein
MVQTFGKCSYRGGGKEGIRARERTETEAEFIESACVAGPDKEGSSESKKMAGEAVICCSEGQHDILQGIKALCP